jgi:hypothetical protein
VDVNASPGQSVQKSRKNGNQGFPFSRIHFDQLAPVHGDAGNDLDVEGSQPYCTPHRFPYEGIGLDQKIVKGRALFSSRGKARRPYSQLAVRDATEIDCLDLVQGPSIGAEVPFDRKTSGLVPQVTQAVIIHENHDLPRVFDSESWARN